MGAKAPALLIKEEIFSGENLLDMYINKAISSNDIRKYTVRLNVIFITHYTVKGKDL